MVKEYSLSLSLSLSFPLYVYRYICIISTEESQTKNPCLKNRQEKNVILSFYRSPFRKQTTSEDSPRLYPAQECEKERNPQFLRRFKDLCFKSFKFLRRGGQTTERRSLARNRLFFSRHFPQIRPSRNV